MKVSASPREDLLREIKSDNLSGASQLAEKSARFLLDYLGAATEAELLEEIGPLGRALVDTQPAMAPMVNLVNHLFRAIEILDDPLEIKRRGTAAVQGFLEGLLEGTQKIRDHALPLLEGKRTLVTHSYSSTVLGVLEHAQAVEVICPEARPLCEGLRTARALGEKGIKVKLVVDFAALSLVRDCDLVMVGADSITPEAVVNKTGTYGFALAAKEEGIPFYVLASKEKCLVAPFCQTLRIETNDPGEVTQEIIPNAAVENVYFDLTPLRLVSGVVMQEGVISAEGVRERLQNMEISEGLRTL